MLTTPIVAVHDLDYGYSVGATVLVAAVLLLLAVLFEAEQMARASADSAVLGETVFRDYGRESYGLY